LYCLFWAVLGWHVSNLLAISRRSPAESFSRPITVPFPHRCYPEVGR
jgi:hypothetical protein